MGYLAFISQIHLSPSFTDSRDRIGITKSITMEKRILIIEDEKEIRELFQIILETQNYQTTALTHAPDPEYILKENFDLVLLDIRLLGSKYFGNVLCKMFKSKFPDNRIPILLTSAEANGDILAKECGADDFLQKPFNIDELIEKAHILMGSY